MKQNFYLEKGTHATDVYINDIAKRILGGVDIRDLAKRIWELENPQRFNLGDKVYMWYNGKVSGGIIASNKNCHFVSTDYSDVGCMYRTYSIQIEGDPNGAPSWMKETRMFSEMEIRNISEIHQQIIKEE